MAICGLRPSAIRTALTANFALLALLSIAARTSRADSAAFDLAGPRIQMTVTRAGKTLPISDVPNLQPGDRLWIHPDFPESQSVHYLLIVAFLRGSTNPPPYDWFRRAETWKKIRQVQKISADAYHQSALADAHVDRAHIGRMDTKLCVIAAGHHDLAKLVRELQRESAAALKPIRLSVFRFNEGSIRFHQRLGFTLIGEDEIQLHFEWKP